MNEYDEKRSPKRAIDIRIVMQKCSKRRTWIYEAVKAGILPAPFRLGGSARWFESEIDDALERAALETRGAGEGL